jgi:hypothetical protein
MTVGMLFFISFILRLITIVLEQKHQLEAINIVYSIRYGQDNFKLNEKYYSKLCFIIEMFVNYLLKVYKFVITYLTLIVYSLVVLYCFLTAGLTFSYTMIFGCFFWTLIVWITMSIFFCGFFAYFGPVIVLMYRFKQVNQRIKYCGSNIDMLILSIHEHHEICRYTAIAVHFYFLN